MQETRELMNGVNGKFLAARLYDIVCYYYVGQDSDDNFRAFEAWSNSMPQKCPRGTGTIVWVDEKGALNPPADAVRKKYADLALRNAHRQFARVSIVQATGFGGATIRAVLTSLQRFQRLPFPQHVTDDPSAALRWLMARMPVDPARPSVEEAVQFFQSTLDDYRRIHG